GKLEAQLKEAEEVGFKEAKNAVDDDFLKGYDEKIKQNIKSLEFENELIENPRPRGREPQDRYISLAYFMANFAQHYKLLDLKNPRTKEQIKLLENALKKQNIGYEVLENEPVAIRYFKKEGVKRQGAKQKTINKVDEYAKSEEFKALSEDKQEAILSLKNLEPSIMPSEISKDNLENILKHFNSKQDKARREFYAKLFNDTKENPHIVLEVKRENELRQEYIKAYQHKDTHDLYYIAITKDKDTINVTGYPITKIKDVINQIKNAEKVVWRQQGDQTHTALVSKETQNLESVNESIAQNSQEAKIKEAVKNHNAIYKEILDNDYIFTDERSKIFRKRKRELIENLAKDEKVQAFTSQWGYPFKKDGELRGVGLDYKAKVYGKGEHKMMHVSGGGFGSATQQKKEKRLLELEKERLQEAFKADFGIDGFMSKYVENEFFKTLWRETGAYKGTDYGWGVQPREYYPYYENRIMPSDTITQAKEKLQKEKSSWSVKRQEAKGSEDIIFTDKKGKEHTLTKETQKAWLEAFNLKSLDEEAIVEIPADLKERLGKEIKLNKKDFEKLMKNKREKYIPQIKETFKEPEAVFIDENDDLIFTKTFNDKLFFVNVNRDYGEAFKALSLAPKKNNNLLNKLNKAKEILKLDSKLRDYTAQQAFTGVLSASNKSSGEIIPQIPKDNSQLNVLHTKIQQVRQQIAESKNPDKKYLHQVFKPDEIIELEKQYFNQAMPQEYKELIQDFPQLYEQRLANELKAYIKDTDVIQEVSAQLLNDFKDKSFKDTAKHAKLLLFNTLRDKAQELGFKELDINEPSFKVAFGKFQAKLKKGDIQDLSEHIAINSLQHDRLRIQEALNLTPLKEFGTNYAEFYRDGKGAVEKLLKEAEDFKQRGEKGEFKGQVSGAFYKEGLGEIDLVWGDENFGLRHIIDKHGDEFEDIAAELSEAMEKGVLKKQNEVRSRIEFKDFAIGLSGEFKGEKRAFIITAFKRNGKSSTLSPKQDFTDKSDNVLSNQEDIIPQKPQQKALNLQEIEQALKARKSQINDEISANDKAFKENLKEASKVKPILEALKKEWEALEPTIVTWTHTDYSKAKPKKYYKRRPNLSNLWHIEETLDVYKGYAGESTHHANQVAREIALLEKYVKSLKDKEAEVKAFKAKAEADENALILESRIISIYNQLREAFKKGHHTTKQMLEANNIKQDSELAKEVIDSIAQTRQYLEDTFNIKPLEEFGTNYAEFYRDGKGAVEKLLKEAEDFKQRGEKGEFKGQVSGAFYKEGLGEIDLVWGDENFGLRHIIDKHGDEFEDIAAELDEIIAKGVLEKGEHRYFIKHNDYKGMIALDYKGKESNAWILTLYKDKSALNPAYQHQIKHNTNTSSETRANGEFENSNIKNANLQKEKVDKLFHGDAEVISAQGKFNELEALNLTDEDIIPQQKIKFAMEKFHYDEKKAKDLLEWHKNSHALTKDENGLPKVFYHGTYSKFRVFRRVGK
ncbi:hypothetical protein RT889_001719, partial [Campylobacter upsaliensis]|nr:hypothetical protein [Campylobacter upsaliensis]